VKIGAWNKAMEKLTSPEEYAKETKMKSSLKTQSAVEKLMEAKMGIGKRESAA